MAEQKTDAQTGPSVDERLSAREQIQKEIAERRRAELEAESKESFPGTGEAPTVEATPDEQAEAAGGDNEPSLEEAGTQATAAAESEEETVASSTSSEVPGASNPSTAAPTQTFDPNAEYELEVEGQKVKVKGDKIFDAGKRTIQKEAAADYRLKMASELLLEAQRRAASLPPGGPTQTPAPAPVVKAPTGLDENKLAEMIQYGTREQAAEAIKTLRESGKAVHTPEQILAFVAPRIGRVVSAQIEFQKAVDMVQKDYADILGDDYLRRLFFVEENRRRAPREQGGEGDTRTHMDLYKSIGDDLRKRFKPTSTPAPTTGAPATLAEKEKAKAQAPVVPQTASARIERKGEAKAPTTSEIIAKMRSARHQPNDRR